MACAPVAWIAATEPVPVAGVSKPSTSYAWAPTERSTVPSSWYCHVVPTAGCQRPGATGAGGGELLTGGAGDVTGGGAGVTGGAVDGGGGCGLVRGCLEDALRATPPIAADDVAISWELGA